MPEVRFDPIGRRHVLLAPERASRGTPPLPAGTADPAPCDFCEGREDRTPPETYAIRGPGTPADAPGWRVRVVPNLYPATAVHEVVVHTPYHDRRFEELPPDARLDVFRAYRARSAAAGTPSVLCAFNRGIQAGASRSHEHGQIFGVDLVPPTLAREADAFAAEPCVLCELAEGAPTVSDHVVAHPVPLVAHELLIVPPCSPRFEAASDDELAVLGEALSSALGRLRRALGEGLATNVVIHIAPAGAGRFHWHAHVYPRTAIWGALEVGAELPIVSADPEATAGLLRGA